MRRSLLCLVLLVGVASAVTTAAAELASLDWLLGNWQRTGMAAGTSGAEQWRRQADVLEGEGRSYRQGELQFQERLRIIDAGGQLYYVADVAGNPAPVRFALVEQGAQSVVFENLRHDFPQRIAYQRNGRQLTATVSAGERVQVFEFEQAAQPTD
ncbi:DUF6265 family protein [uncultured Stenotrophomonas sp.]|uniref:DUF6265 family protein n=1 Tax=uncultured Stenotrophomonas sp. TaxID=165438 RepID=UPI0025E4674F|nr:DUF6265 family protein [uncultured Stenotrophomonas sp.]